MGKDIEKIFESTSWETKTLAAIGYAEPFIDGIVEMADPAIEPVVAKAMAEAVAGLQDVKNTIQQGTAAPGSSKAREVVAGLNSVKANLSSLLTDAQVKNSATSAKVTGAVNLVVGLVDAAIGTVTA